MMVLISGKVKTLYSYVLFRMMELLLFLCLLLSALLLCLMMDALILCLTVMPTRLPFLLLVMPPCSCMCLYASEVCIHLHHKCTRQQSTCGIHKCTSEALLEWHHTSVFSHSRKHYKALLVGMAAGQYSNQHSQFVVIVSNWITASGI